MKNICISGIHTDTGKSHVSAAFCYAFGFEYFKLVQAGEVTDTDFLSTMVPNLVAHKAGISLKTAASPHIGMKKEGVNFQGLNIEIPKKENLLIELAGGLFTPLDFDKFMIDYMEFHRLETFLVSKNYLGSINHTAMSIECLLAKNIKILGVIFSGDSDKENEDYLRKHYANLDFLSLGNFDFGFEKASLALKNEILKKGIKL